MPLGWQRRRQRPSRAQPSDDSTVIESNWIECKWQIESSDFVFIWYYNIFSDFSLAPAPPSAIHSAWNKNLIRFCVWVVFICQRAKPFIYWFVFVYATAPLRCHTSTLTYFLDFQVLRAEKMLCTQSIDTIWLNEKGISYECAVSMIVDQWNWRRRRHLCSFGVSQFVTVCVCVFRCLDTEMPLFTFFPSHKNVFDEMSTSPS